MEAMVTQNIEKPISWNWHFANTQLLHRFIHILLRDIIPTLAMTVVVAWGAFIVSEQIDQAKLSRTSDMVAIFQDNGYPTGISLPTHECVVQYEND